MAKLLSILLQRSDTSFPWGFQVTGGKDIGTSVTITKVTPKTLAAQYLSPGDIVLEVEKLDSRLLRSTDIETIINRPAKCLDLLIRKSEDNRVNSSNGLHSNADYVDKTNYNNSSKENRSNVFDHSQSNKTGSRNQYGSDGINNSFTSNSNNYASDSNSSVYSTTKRTNPRLAKQLFWDRCSQEKKDWGSGFTRFSSFDNNSPYKERLSRNDEWRRRNSEEMTESESYEERYSSETEEYRQHSSGEESLPFRAHSIWSESPMRDFEVKVKKLNRGLSVDNRASSYKNTSSDRRYNRWQSSFEDYEPFETKNRKTSTSSTSQYADSLSDDQFSNLGSNYSFSGASSTLKKPSDFWDEHFRCESFKQKSTPTTPEATETGYTEKTFKKSTEFSRSTSLIEKTAHNSYSDNSGGNKTTVEKVENVSEFEQSSVVDGNNKREEIVKEKENKQEYYLSKYGDKKQERKVQSNYEIMEKRVNDKREFLNKIKNRNEESNTSSVAEEIDGGEGHQKIERKDSESEERLNTKQRSDHQQNDNITSYQENNSQQYHNISSNQKDNISQYSTTTKEEKDNIPQYNESTEKDKFPLPEDKDLNILKSSEKDTSQHSKLTEKNILNGGLDKHIPPQLSASLSSTDNNVNSSSDSCCSEERHVRQNSAERWVTPKGYCKPTSYSSVKPLENSDKDAAPVELKIIEDSDEKSNRRQSSQLSGGSTPGSPQGDVGVVVPPPPPPCPPAPPPPPPLGSSLPSVRLTSEIGDSRRSCHEPPAAIQNAMMTKDKKPFTYTPGGLDLSEIRSPRMARRITRNANAPDTVVPQPAKTSPLANSNQPLPPSAVAAMQPQIAIPVFPQGGVTPQLHHVTPGGHTTPPSPPSSSQPPPPPPPPQQYTPPTPPAPPQQSPPAPMSVPKLQPQHRQTKSEPQQNTPGSLYVPPIQSQQQEPQQQIARSQLGSLYIPPLNAQEQRATATPTSQSPVLNKAPTPWMSKQSQQQKEVPAWVNREDNVVSSQSSNVASPPDAHARIIPIQIEGRDPPQQSAPFNATANTTQVRTSTNTTTAGSTAGSPGTRIIPIQIEGASSPQQNKQQPAYQQQQRQSGYQQQYQPPQQQQQYHPPQQQQQYQPQQQHQQSQQYQPQQQQQHSPQQRWMNQQPVYVHNKFNTSGQPQPQQVQPTTPSGISHAHNNHSTVDGSSNGSNNPRQLQTQQSWGNSGNTHSTVNGTTSNPVQSRSFRVLQKITDTEGGTDQMDAPYNTQGVPLSQLRKLQLSEDDRALMNKVKTQVDEENYLHNESDPRYRGASIPSRAFRMLQSMTDSAGSDDMEVPRAAAQVQTGQNRLSANRVQQESQPQPYIPPSEQQVQEPRKYTGGAIPSRSFRMLQAMTAGPDNTAVVTDGRQTPQYVNGGDGMWVPPSYNYPIALPPPVPPLSTPHGYYPQFYPPQTPEEHQQFWDHYAQMCAYLAEINAAYGYMGAYPTMYSPSPMVHYASDSDECGYSSTDEMTYYGSIFKRYPPPVLPYRGAYPIENRSVTPQIVITPSNYNEYKTTEKTISSDHLISEECFENGEASTATDGSDTEVENDSCTSPLGLQTIRSVPDIRIYKDSSCSDVQSRYSETDEHESEDDNDDEDDDNEEDDETEENSSNSNIPHQLSIIFEESEQSSEADTIKKVKDNCVNQIKITSDCDEDDDNDSDDDNDESSTATLDHIADTDNCDDDDDDVVEPEATVVVRLPLKLQFSRSDNNEDVTTVIVGDSEVESSPEVQSDLNVQPSFEVKNNEHKGDLIIQEVRKVEEPEVSVTFSFPKKKLSVKEMVQRIESIKDTEQTEIKNKEEKKHRSESPVDFWKMLGNDDTNSLKMSEDSSSASIAVSPSKMSQHRSFDNFTSESEESRPEESDGGHWEDDSSSTSVQTVKIGKVFSGSENFSADEMAGTADEVDDIQVQNKLLTDNNNHDKTECDKSDDSSSSSDEESTSSASSTSNSSSSGSSCDDSKQTEEANTVSTISTDSNKNDSKLDDDVFVPEVISNVPKNTNTNKNGVTNNINSNNNNNNNNSLCIKKKKERQNCDNGQDDSEEDDSGVTSDMSRHISETDTDVECGSELRKMSRYQRAATHSRLFKLLQDECNGDAAENDDCGDEYWKSDDMTLRKEQLTLPLKTNSASDPDSLSSSSGVNSPSSPTVSDRLVKELVKSLLQKKKGRVFRKLPLKKLHAAALRILQEDMDPYDTVSSTSDDSSFVHSPVSSMPSSCEATTSEANNNAAIQQSSASPDIYGGNYYDYCDYYNTWRDPWYHSGIEASLGNDIVPSRAFRLLQEHAQNSGFRGGLIEGLWAKCPRVVSSKNIPKDLRTIQNDKNPQTSSSTET